MTDQTANAPALKPLKITCTSTDCANDLHCFRSTKKLAAVSKGGRCRSCGVDLVDWNRVHKRSLEDVDYTFTALRFELIRHYFWHAQLTQRVVNHVRRKGKAALRSFANGQLRRLVGTARHAREGYQTPRETSSSANAIHFAQHATACCCRKCAAEWHGIQEDRSLTEQELAYFTDLVMRYVEDRVPDLSESGIAAPAMRRSQASQTDGGGGRTVRD
jgi:hypothetical protein